MNRKAIVLLATVLAIACDRSNETRTITLNHLQPDAAVMMIEPYVAGGGRSIRAVRQPGSTVAAVLTITAPREQLDRVQELLARYDIPSPTVTLAFQVIEADGFTNTDPAIADVEASLRELFRFGGYRLAAEAHVVGRSFAETSQMLSGPRGQPMRLDVNFADVAFTPERGAATFSVALSLGDSRVLATTVTVPSGRTVVLGSARPAADLPALILVVRPQIAP